MTKDKRYKTVKNLITDGHIKSFDEIFDTLPKSIVYKDLGMNNNRFNFLLENIDHFDLKDIFRIAALIEIDEKVLLDLTYKQYQLNKKNKIKS